MAKYVYPAIFHQEDDGGYSVSFPDLPCATQGEDLADAIDMAEDALALLLYSYEEDKKDIPEPSNIKNIISDDYVSFISCDTFSYRKQFNNKAVKKTLSIPEWLNEIAIEANINFSQVLQEALKTKLGVY
ncbi:Predicted nuclease of the RNAse H fold, HicB family [Lachnospiraceae bacterium NE2001]|nr:Predicted nuclease of the RNAse H fold, HicB family [Lachnospiraceae bacterium NE2001]